MLNFKSYITENKKKAKKYKHHKKGSFTLHSDEKGTHHLKNEYGEITHTFTNMTPEKVTDELRSKHDIHTS